MDKYDYQPKAIQEAVEFVKTSPRGSRRLYSSPTGTGKSRIQNGIRETLTSHIQIVPSIEIAAGMLGCPASFDETEPQGVFTIKRALNVWSNAPTRCLSASIDEGHHSSNDEHQTLFELMGNPTLLGFTASPYRGTPQETKKLYDYWGGVTKILTIHEATERGVISIPSFDVWPLVNDDLIEVQNGEFTVRQVDSAVRDVAGELTRRIGQFFRGSLWDRATCVFLPSVATLRHFEELFSAAGLPFVSITSETGQRQELLSRVVSRECILLNISVIGEGVDLPLRRLIDVAPTMSPVRWIQRVGRITRPVGEIECSICDGTSYIRESPPSYITTNHNLTRHAYLYEGMIPPVALRDNRAAWGKDWKPNRRHLTRAIGIEGFGRFKPSEVPLFDGSFGTLYAFQVKGGTHQYAVLLLPSSADSVFFHRENSKAERVDEDTWIRSWGKWKVIGSLPNVEGCVSIKPGMISPKQVSWWVNSASKYGLDPQAEVNNRVFLILPVLSDTRLKVV